MVEAEKSVASNSEESDHDSDHNGIDTTFDQHEESVSIDGGNCVGYFRDNFQNFVLLTFLINTFIIKTVTYSHCSFLRLEQRR